jgi:enoyl-CoA hydratase/carnithine racemase
MIGELGELLAEVERNEEPAVLVFDSADPDYFFLAHYDIAADPGLVNSLAAGPTGFHPWVDVLVRVSRLPAVTISAIRGRTLEILLGGEDFNGELAERYGYVNRAIPDDEFEDGLQQRSDVELHLGEYVGRLQKAKQ